MWNPSCRSCLFSFENFGKTWFGLPKARFESKLISSNTGVARQVKIRVFLGPSAYWTIYILISMTALADWFGVRNIPLVASKFGPQAFTPQSLAPGTWLSEERWLKPRLLSSSLCSVTTQKERLTTKCFADMIFTEVSPRATFTELPSKRWPTRGCGR